MNNVFKDLYNGEPLFIGEEFRNALFNEESFRHLLDGKQRDAIRKVRSAFTTFIKAIDNKYFPEALMICSDENYYYNMRDKKVNELINQESKPGPYKIKCTYYPYSEYGDGEDEVKKQCTFTGKSLFGCLCNLMNKLNVYLTKEDICDEFYDECKGNIDKLPNKMLKSLREMNGDSADFIVKLEDLKTKKTLIKG